MLKKLLIAVIAGVALLGPVVEYTSPVQARPNHSHHHWYKVYYRGHSIKHWKKFGKFRHAGSAVAAKNRLAYRGYQAYVR